MTKQPRNDRQRNPLHDCLGCMCVTKIMKANAGKTGPFPDPGPEPEIVSIRPPRIDGRGKHERAFPVPLSVDDGASVLAQVHCPRAGLAVDEPERVSVDLGPPQVLDFALACPREQEQADDVRLPRPFRSLGDKLIDGIEEADDFFRRQESGEARPRILPCAPGGVQGDVAGRDGMVHDLPENCQRPVGIPRRRQAVVVEPSVNASRM